MADDGDGLIVRLYEAHNQRGPAVLHFAHTIKSAVEVNLLELETSPVQIDDHDLHFNVRPFEVKTFRVRLAST
jgi:alpha-mannosidase